MFDLRNRSLALSPVRHLALIQAALVHLFDLSPGVLLPNVLGHLLPFWVRLVLEYDGVAHGLVEGLRCLVEQLEELVVVLVHLPPDLLLYLLQLLLQLMLLLRETDLL